MPMNDFGVTFNPASSLDQSKRGGSPDPNANVQQAIQSLSLRLPTVVGAKSIAPQSLLQGGGMQALPGQTGQNGPAGQFGGLSLQQIVQMLMGKQPVPNVIPGVAEGEPNPGSFKPIGTNEQPQFVQPPPRTFNKAMPQESQYSGGDLPNF